MKKNAKKPTRAEQLQDAKNRLRTILNVFQLDDIMQFVFDKLEGDIEYIDGNIEDDIGYIKWESNSYSSAKSEARQRIKYLRKNKQVRIKAMKELKKAYATVKKVKDVE